MSEPMNARGAGKQQERDGLKRQFIDSLEMLREEAAHGSAPPEDGEKAGDALYEREIARLRQELRLAQRTTALLEKDLHRLEQKALEAIAEAGELRRRIDTMQHGCETAGDKILLESERETLMARLDQEKESRHLLTEALHHSEREIARLMKNLDIFSRKFSMSEWS